jgi:hypothetical protein
MEPPLNSPRVDALNLDKTDRCRARDTRGMSFLGCLPAGRMIGKMEREEGAADNARLFPASILGILCVQSRYQSLLHAKSLVCAQPTRTELRGDFARMETTAAGEYLKHLFTRIAVIIPIQQSFRRRVNKVFRDFWIGSVGSIDRVLFFITAHVFRRVFLKPFCFLRRLHGGSGAAYCTKQPGRKKQWPCTTLRRPRPRFPS